MNYSSKLKEMSHGEYFDAGVKAAKSGKAATDCPYPTGLGRKDWLVGFFSIRPPAVRKS